MRRSPQTKPRARSCQITCCLSRLLRLYDKMPQTGGLQQHDSTSHSLGGGKSESRVQAGWKRRKGPSGASFTGTLIPLVARSPPKISPPNTITPGVGISGYDCGVTHCQTRARDLQSAASGRNSKSSSKQTASDSVGRECIDGPGELGGQRWRSLAIGSTQRTPALLSAELLAAPSECAGFTFSERPPRLRVEGHPQSVPLKRRQRLLPAARLLLLDSP